MTNLVELAANATDAFTAVVFILNNESNTLRPAAVRTLSRDFVHDASIGLGCGLVGWTAENSVRISVCPFEHDATTLLYYRADQGLKSFIAIPILGHKDRLIGVLTCDSKKPHAFAKIGEKILQDLAAQVGAVYELYSELDQRKSRVPTAVSKSLLARTMDNLRGHSSEQELLSLAAKLPQELVVYDSLAIVVTDGVGTAAGEYYSSSQQERSYHRLLELVCRHKKILCGDKTVHALPDSNSRDRSFLSVPFRVLDREAGSVNLLSLPGEAFSANDITVVEKLAAVVGNELERIRLRARLEDLGTADSLLSWRHFKQQAAQYLDDAVKRKESLALVRISLTNTAQVEQLAGIDISLLAAKKLLRLVEQVKRSPAISCPIYGNQVMVLTQASEARRFVKRLECLAQRLPVDAMQMDDLDSAAGKVNTALCEGLQATIVISNPEDTSVEALVNRANQAQGESPSKDSGLSRLMRWF